MDTPFPTQVINIPPPTPPPDGRGGRWLSRLQLLLFLVGAGFLLWQYGGNFLGYFVRRMPTVIATSEPASFAGYFPYEPAIGTRVPTAGKIVMLNRMSPGRYDRLRARDRLRAVTSLHLHASDEARSDFIVLPAETCVIVVAKVRAIDTRPKRTGVAGWLFVRTIPCANEIV
jgi:hypothetical protein